LDAHNRVHADLATLELRRMLQALSTGRNKTDDRERLQPKFLPA